MTTIREALRIFVGAAYPVSTEIDPRGHRWSEAYLDQALDAARAALDAQPAQPERMGLDAIRAAIEDRDAMEAKYHDLAENMVYRNSVSWWHSKATAYRDAVGKVWDELKAAGIVCDGKKTCADGVRELAAQPAQAWVSVTERMPTAGVKVLVCYRNSYDNLRRTCAHYSPLHTVDASTWDEGEPDETEDGTFEPEGWWEEPVELERVEFISDEVTHWMPLPAPPEYKP